MNTLLTTPPEPFVSLSPIAGNISATGNTTPAFAVGGSVATTTYRTLANGATDRERRLDVTVTGGNTTQVWIADDETDSLTVTINKSFISEAFEQATVTVSRSGSVASSLDITLSTSDAGEALIISPGPYRIPAGATSADFIIQGVPDGLVDADYDLDPSNNNDQIVAVTASVVSGALNRGIALLPVRDVDVPNVQLTFEDANGVPISAISEGDLSRAAVGRLSIDNLEARNSRAEWGDINSEPITFSISAATGALNALGDEVNVYGGFASPTQVIIPAGHNTTTFDIDAIDDFIADGNQLVTFTASAANGFFGTAAANLLVTDQLPEAELSVVVGSTSISEGGSTNNVTVTRSGSTANPFTIGIRALDPLTGFSTDEVSLDGGGATTTVTFATGQSVINFAFSIAGVNDGVADGNQPVVFEFVNAATLDTRTDSLDVLDSQIPTLTVTVTGAAVFAEDAGAGASTLTITRNTPTDVPLTVTIVSSDPTEARTATTAFIPVGSTSITVPVASIDELISDGTNIVQFTAAAAGFVSDTAQVRVTAVDNVEFYNRLGDRNLERQQGQLRIEGNTIRFPSQWGIEVASTPSPDNGTQTHPGPLRNFPTLSTDKIVPGATIINNVVANLGNGQGGIHVSGSSSNVPASNPFVRIINNTVFGEEILQQQTNRTQADIIFMVDVSGSMQPNIDALKAELAQFDQRVNSTIDALYGLIMFPGPGNTDPVFLIDLMPFSQFVVDPLFVNLTDSPTGLEEGSRAILEALDDPNFIPATDFTDRRPNAVTVPIVFTDEDDDSSITDQRAALALLQQRKAVFFGIDNPDAPGPNNTASTYEAFAQVTGGSTFDIDDFLLDPTSFFISFSNAFLSAVGGAASGTAILVDNNASPTILNNIIANTARGLTDLGTGTVIGANFFQGNTNPGSLGTNAIVAQPNAQGNLPPLFVEPRLGNFYLAKGTAAIDSSLNSFQDRPNFVAVKSPLGLAESPIVAPEIDAFGQKRLDDPSQPSATGLGQNIFKDRGAIERADFDGGFARLDIPRDNGGNPPDLDPRDTRVWLANPSFPNQFVVELVDNGVGINDDLITSLQFQLFQDGTLLRSRCGLFLHVQPELESCDLHRANHVRIGARLHDPG